MYLLLSAGGLIKKGHRRDRSDGGIDVARLADEIQKEKSGKEKGDSREEDSEKDAKEIKTRKPSPKLGPIIDRQESRDSAHHMTPDLDQSKSPLWSRDKSAEKRERKEVEKMFRADVAARTSPFADTNPFRDDVDSTVTSRPLEREFTNMSFVDDVMRDEQVPAEHVEEARARVMETLAQWKTHAQTIDDVYESARAKIELRKQQVLAAIDDVTTSMLTQLDARHTTEREEAATAVRQLQQLQDSCDASDVTTADLPRRPVTEPCEFVFDSNLNLKTALGPFFGQVQIRPIAQSFGHPGPNRSQTDNVQVHTRHLVDGTFAVLRVAEFCGVFRCVTNKDARECGITDVALTNDSEIVVVDRHNKLVKVFDHRGTLLRFVGRHSLKQPSRVTVLPWSNQILVSDNATKSLNLYHTSGSILGPFATELQFPIAHCVLAPASVAVVDFETKECAVYEFQASGSVERRNTFALGLDTPAYITATGSGQVVVSDWSANKVRFYDVATGDVIREVSKSGNGVGELKKPARCRCRLFWSRVCD